MNGGPRKRRTRGHVIADLAINYLERCVLRCGHVLQRMQYDYGIDLLMYTFNARGEVQNGEVKFQVKATERFQRLSSRPVIAWRLEVAHLRHWLNEGLPVILVGYEAESDTACWLYVQEHFEGHRRFGLTKIEQTITIHVPDSNLLSESTVRQFVQFRDNLAGVVRRRPSS